MAEIWMPKPVASDAQCEYVKFETRGFTFACKGCGFVHQIPEGSVSKEDQSRLWAGQAISRPGVTCGKCKHENNLWLKR